MPQYNVVIVFSTDNNNAADAFANALATVTDAPPADILLEHATITAEDGSITDLLLPVDETQHTAPYSDASSETQASAQATQAPATGEEPASESVPSGKEF